MELFHEPAFHVSIFVYSASVAELVPPPPPDMVQTTSPHTLKQLPAVSVRSQTLALTLLSLLGFEGCVMRGRLWARDGAEVGSRLLGGEVGED